MNGQGYLSKSTKNADLSFKVTSTGVYYIRVKISTSTTIRKFVSFKIVAKVNGVQKVNYVQMLSKDDYISKRTNAVSFTKFTTTKTCQANLNYNGPAFTKIEIYTPDQIING